MMNLNTIRIRVSGLLLIAGIFLAGCHKKDNPAPGVPPNTSAPVKTGTLMFHLHTYLDDVEADGYNITYTTTEGRKISLSMAQLYISNIQLIKKDGSAYTIPNTVLLKDIDHESYLAGEVPVGDYKALKFQVGLNAETNLKSPSTDPKDVLNKPEMWFGNAAQPVGYVFVNLQGKIDTTSDASGTEAKMQPFHYRIGTNANYKQVAMPEKGFTIIEGQFPMLHMYVDYSMLFRGVKLNKSENLTMDSPSANATALGAKLAANIPYMFRFE